jgi:hypothetical protein
VTKASPRYACLAFAATVLSQGVANVPLALSRLHNPYPKRQLVFTREDSVEADRVLQSFWCESPEIRHCKV